MDQATIERVMGQVDEKAIVDLASELIRIPSFKTEETPVARFLDGFFRERGYGCRVWCGSEAEHHYRWLGTRSKCWGSS